MNGSTSEEKKNPVVTLKAQAEKFNFSMLRAGEDNAKANSGYQAYKDIDRMNFVIQNKTITKEFINELYNKYDALVESKQYREFAKEVFKEMFKYAGAEVPSDPILEELVTNCNQAGYEGALFTQNGFKLNKYSLMLLNPVEKAININCADINHITVKSDMIIPIVKSDDPEEAYRINSSLEFTLESQDRKDSVTYKDGKLSLTIPEELKDYPVVDEMQQSKSLFDVIKEIFFQLIEKVFGHTNDIKIIEENDVITMAGSFGKSLKVKSTLKEVKPIMSGIEATRDK
ncbi:MAG: hypothetical protein LBC34_03170 [Rickettsiales bacterium]|jgi:hypothetical protein|nr:hypothetical protein [Rickettsiales bacterium]